MILVVHLCQHSLNMLVIQMFDALHGCTGGWKFNDCIWFMQIPQTPTWWLQVLGSTAMAPTRPTLVREITPVCIPTSTQLQATTKNRTIDVRIPADTRPQAVTTITTMQFPTTSLLLATMCMPTLKSATLATSGLSLHSMSTVMTGACENCSLREAATKAPGRERGVAGL